MRGIPGIILSYIAADLALPSQSVKAAVFGFLGEDDVKNVIIFQFFELLVGERFFSVTCIVNQIIKVKKIEMENSIHIEKKVFKYNRKWCKTTLTFPV